MSSTRVIKKYPNRRLYDTADSRYITLADIRTLVAGNVRLRVVDKKSGNDITRAILLQVISEQEQGDDAVMSTVFLEQLIRACNSGSTQRLARSLERSIAALDAGQDPAEETRARGNGGGSPADVGDAPTQFAVAAGVSDDVPTARVGASRDRN
jgi:polyhydroxyalkanoate synthesis repressor PhaR